MEQPDKPKDVTNQPLPLKSEPVEVQEPETSTLATPFAQPKIASKSRAQIQREYRQRFAASKTPAQAAVARELKTARQRRSRLRKAARLAITSDSHEATTTSSSRSEQRFHDEVRAESWNTKWASSIMRFKSTFLDNDFGYACSICDRLWFRNDLKPITAAQLKVISDWFIKKNLQLSREEYKLVCYTCKRSLNKQTIPLLAKVNGFSYPDPPPGLPPLDPISERLISPRLPFMQVRRLRHDFSYGIVEQVINVPFDVEEMVKCLPRQLDEDKVINVNIERNLAHNSVYLSGYMSNSTVTSWLTVLQNSPLYSFYEIKVDLSRLNLASPDLDDDGNSSIIKY